MSPEQVRGKPVDRRADIWAFGCILFESLTGRRAFEEEALADLMVAVSEREPDWSRLPTDTPVGIRHLLERCLTKDLRLRLQAAGEARIRLEDPDRVDLVSSVESPRSIAPRVVVAASVVIALLLGYTLGSRGPEDSPPATVRLGVELPPGVRLDLPNPRSGGLSGVAPPLSISADGRMVVYLAKEDEGASGLYLRQLDSYQTRLLEGTENAEAPFFSPNGQWVGFFGEDGIYKVAVEGGSAPVPVCSIPLIDRPSASWARDDTIYFSRGINAEGRIEQVPASGGEPSGLTVPNFAEGDSWHGMPQLLPDEKTVLFTIASRTGGGTRAALLDLETREYRVVEDTGEAAGSSFPQHGRAKGWVAALRPIGPPARRRLRPQQRKRYECALARRRASQQLSPGHRSLGLFGERCARIHLGQCPRDGAGSARSKWGDALEVSRSWRLPAPADLSGRRAAPLRLDQVRRAGHLGVRPRPRGSAQAHLRVPEHGPPLGSRWRAGGLSSTSTTFSP